MAQAPARPIDVYETYERSIKGKKMPESDWDYKVIPETAASLKAEMGIQFGSEFIPTDKAQIDALFQAGLQMLVRCGVYNADTGRIVKVTEAEVREGIKKAPKKLVLGDKRDAVEMLPRKGNSPRKPIIQGGPTGAPVSEEMFIPLIQSYAQEATVDTIVNGVMATIEGKPATTNTPWEIKATLAELRAIREACNRAGRPHMGI
jgi:methylamine--corrinoid protein Co-methyltransferase